MNPTTRPTVRHARFRSDRQAKAYRDALTFDGRMAQVVFHPDCATVYWREDAR